MSDSPRGGEAGYWARRVQYAREVRVLSGYVRPLRPRPTSRELDPHTAPVPQRVLAAERDWLDDMTPGLDEAHCRPGHPAYQPKGP